MKQTTIITLLIANIVTVLLIAWLTIFQSFQISDVQTETAKIKMQSLDDEEDSEEDVYKMQWAILDLNDRLDVFIEVHDENVEVINDMYDTLEYVVEYLSQ